MKKCLIGIPVNSYTIEGKLAPPRWTGNSGSPMALVELGALPVIIPPLGRHTTLRSYYDMVSGILVSGGADVDPALYGEKKHEMCGPTCPERDVSERHILEWAIEDKKPVLGICRGCQMINITLGGTLFQDLPSQHDCSEQHIIDEEVEDWYVRPHSIKVDPGTKLSSIVGARSFKVNSVHHQAVKDLGKDLVASASSPDGVIEALEHRDQSQFLLGIQCHPEVLWQEDEHWKKVFVAFIEACKKFDHQQAPTWTI